jgi:NAD(P)-dependent dehydrogenase (short-subunit alcohol dehydrogenase family)
MSGKLNNKVAVITGGSSGIGLATAKTFALEGAKVAITGRNQASLDAAVKEIGHGALAIQGDVSDIAGLGQLFDSVSEKFGKIDILIANAASYVVGPLETYTEEMFDRTSDINFKGTFFTIQKALPHLKDGASIVLVSSTVNEKGVPGHAAYSASKAAIRSLARSFSAELLGRRIRVNVLSPGPVDTPIFDKVTGSKEEARAMADGMASFTPLKRIGRPEELAAAALYLASDDSAFMLGAELLVDGGLRSL